MKIGIIIIIASSLLVFGCGNNDNAQKDGNSDNQSKASEQKIPANPKGYGRITEVKLGEIDPKMAHDGNEVFETKCTACHKLDERYVGPSLRKVTERRTPEWIMNMILDTETMVEKDDTVQCLLQEYMLKMPNQNVDEKDARNVLEHLRLVATQSPDAKPNK